MKIVVRGIEVEICAAQSDCTEPGLPPGCELPQHCCLSRPGHRGDHACGCMRMWANEQQAVKPA